MKLTIFKIFIILLHYYYYYLVRLDYFLFFISFLIKNIEIQYVLHLRFKNYKNTFIEFYWSLSNSTNSVPELHFYPKFKSQFSFSFKIKISFVVEFSMIKLFKFQYFLHLRCKNTNSFPLNPIHRENFKNMKSLSQILYLNL
jgi:hypothetical protein